ncbi:hypothetical protein GCM10027047_02930 [Rhodococcus aerolatus]
MAVSVLVLAAVAVLAVVLLRSGSATSAEQSTSEAGASTSGSAAPDDGCAVDLAAPAVTAAIAAQPAPADGGRWSATPTAGTYRPCAALSTAVVTTTGGPGTPTTAALMFHDGEYVGPEANQVYDVTGVDEAASTDDTVVLDYRGQDGPAQLRVHWDGSRVVLLRDGP